jgi:mono/diheme cytochrome c family protein
MTNPLTFHRGALLLALLTGAALAAPARADNLAVPQLPAYQQECASCHLAYPPGLLPAASWQRLMANLPKHFGTDASLDAPTLKTLSAFLAANAGSYKKVARDPSPPPDDRISRSAWFVREHREIDRATWQRPSIGSPANCAACHTGAAQGGFSERDLRIPK